MFLYRVSFVYDVGLGRPEVKPSTLESLPGRLKELPGKLGWMKWELMNLTAKVRGGGHGSKAAARRWRKYFISEVKSEENVSEGASGGCCACSA